MKAWRIIFGVSGILLLLFGAFRFLTEISWSNLFVLALWMIGAIVVHDGLLSPVIVGVGFVLRRYVPDRGRRYLQTGLIMAGLVTVIALPMIYLRGSQPSVKGLLLRNYGANLTLLIVVIAVVSLALYAVRVARDRRGAPGTKTHIAPSPET